jgi:hypothetical protein
VQHVLTPLIAPALIWSSPPTTLEVPTTSMDHGSKEEEEGNRERTPDEGAHGREPHQTIMTPPTASTLYCMDNNRIGRRRSHNTNKNYFEKEAYLSANNLYISGPLSPHRWPPWPLATVKTTVGSRTGGAEKTARVSCGCVCGRGQASRCRETEEETEVSPRRKAAAADWPATAGIEAAASAPPGGLVCMLTVES